MKLKSTKERVYSMPWTGEGPQPWPKAYLRVLKPVTRKNGLRAITLMVRRDRLDMEV